MDIEQTEILKKASKLSQMIKESDIAKEYESSIKIMQNDKTAQKLIAELVMLGDNINSTVLSGKDYKNESPAEMEFLKEQFEKNTIVKNHLNVQKNYLDLIQKVIEKIKDPTVE